MSKSQTLLEVNAVEVSSRSACPREWSTVVLSGLLSNQELEGGPPPNGPSLPFAWQLVLHLPAIPTAE